LYKTYHFENQISQDTIEHYFVYQNPPRVRTFLTSYQPWTCRLPWTVIWTKIEERISSKTVWTKLEIPISERVVSYYIHYLRMGTRNNQLNSTWSLIKEDRNLTSNYEVCMGSCPRHNYVSAEDAAKQAVDFFWQGITYQRCSSLKGGKRRPLVWLF